MRGYQGGVQGSFAPPPNTRLTLPLPPPLGRRTRLINVAYSQFCYEYMYILSTTSFSPQEMEPLPHRQKKPTHEYDVYKGWALQPRSPYYFECVFTPTPIGGGSIIQKKRCGARMRWWPCKFCQLGMFIFKIWQQLPHTQQENTGYKKKLLLDALQTYSVIKPSTHTSHNGNHIPR